MVLKVTTKEKVLVHLLEHYPTREKYQQSADITQEGMAMVIGSKQNTISYSVRSLVDEGLLNEETTRIKGKKQRRKGYFLTDEGVKKSKIISSRILQSSVKVRSNGEDRDILLKDLNKYLHTNFSLIDIVTRAEDGIIEHDSRDATKERVNYLFNMPEPPVKILGVLKEVSEEFNAFSSVVLLEGSHGSGKTTLLSHLAEINMGKVPMFYLKVEDWHNERYLLEHLAAFFSRNGEHKLTSYLESTKKLKIVEALANLKMDMSLLPGAFMFIDDIDENPMLMGILGEVADEIREMERSMMIFTTQEGKLTHDELLMIQPEIISLEHEECERTMFVELADYYGMSESCEAVLDLVLENNLTPEEHLALSYMSIHRYPVEKNEICGLESVNFNLITNLMKTPLSTLSLEEKPVIHPQVRKRLLGRLPVETKKTLNTIAYEYYDNIPAKTIWEKIEMLYHIASAGKYDLFLEIVEEHGFDIIFGGYSRSLLELIERLGIRCDDKRRSPILCFWKGEANRILQEFSQSLEEYRYVIENGDDEDLITYAHHGIARVLEDQGQFDSALLEYEKAIDISRSTTTSPQLTGKTLFQIANLCAKKGDLKDARKHLTEAIDILEQNSMYTILTSAYFLMARVERDSGNFPDALDVFERGLSAWERIEETYHRVGGLHDIGAFYKVIRDLSNAKEFLKETVEICEQMGYKKLKASALLTLTECYLDKGEFKEAAEAAEEATRIFTELRYEEERAYGHALLGQTYTRLNEDDLAEDNLAKAISIYQKLGSSYPLGLAYFSMAKLQEKMGNKEGIAANYRKSLLSLTSSGANNMIEQVQREMKTIPLSM